MPDSKNSKKKNRTKELRKAVGAVLAAPVAVPLIALSGFMPLPLMVQSARAGTTTLSITGQFITGFSLVKIADMKWGKMVATDTGGKISLTTLGAHAGSVKGLGVAGEQNGIFSYKAVSTAAAFDVTVKGIGPLALGATTGGAAAKGTAKLNTILFGKAFSGGTKTAKCVAGGGTTCKVAVTAGAQFGVKSNPTAEIGGIVSWTTPKPIGEFGQTLTLIISY
jgi:hypothetical protein